MEGIFFVPALLPEFFNFCEVVVDVVCCHGYSKENSQLQIKLNIIARFLAFVKVFLHFAE